MLEKTNIRKTTKAKAEMATTASAVSIEFFILISPLKASS
jgi:hypothetical protein